MLSPPITEDRGVGGVCCSHSPKSSLKGAMNPPSLSRRFNPTQSTGWVEQGLSGLQEVRVAPVSLEAGE